MAKKQKQEKDLEQYRTLIETPKEFKDGFGWTTVAGIFFCGLIMMPGGIYLSLMTGYGLGMAASWVTVILFMEIARRALQPLSKQNLVVLLHAANIMMAANWLFPGGPLGELVFRAYLVSSEAVRDAGMLGAFPDWFAPPPDSIAITERSLLHKDWLVPIGIIAFIFMISAVQRYTLGYFFFRLTSDVEKLPFPLAPIWAQGATALAEAEDTEVVTEQELKTTLDPNAKKKKSPRWRIFSLGAYIGIGFGMIQVGIPAITGLFLSQPFYLIPQPFIDTTTLTEGFLPATPTGMTLDLGIIILGFVLPFWAVVGTFIAILLTLILNPLLHSVGILQTWQPGMDTVNTTFANNIDFWLSFGIGSGFGIAAVCIFSTFKDLSKKLLEIRQERKKRDPKEEERRSNIWDPPTKGRGDYPVWVSLVIYSVSAVGMVTLAWALLPKTINILLFLIFFAFFFNPFISYVNARLLGISGQNVAIPYVKEIGFLLAGSKGIEIWLAPVPIENYGYQAQSFRVNELTGVRFWSLIKTELVALPVLFVLSFTFWGFIWHSDAIPSEVFPAAQVNWELAAKNSVLLYSSTFIAPGEDPDEKSITDSEFMKAIHPGTIAAGFVSITVIFSILLSMGLPTLLVYGMIRGFGQFPHYMMLEIIGAMIGRFYFQKKFGSKNFLQNAPTLMAGYFTGVGLIGMATIAMRLIKAAVSGTPF